MRRVVITGLGIVSSIGNTAEEVTAALKESRSGIVFAPDYAEHGFRSQVKGQPNIDIAEHVDKRALRFMGDGAAWNYIAMDRAIADSGLEAGDVIALRDPTITDDETASEADGSSSSIMPGGAS